MNDAHERPLTSRSFVARTEAERLYVALAELSLEHGYEALGVEQIAAAGGVSRARFDELFADKDACFSGAYRAAVRQGFARAARAFEDAGPAWPEGIHAGLGALLEFAAANPAFAHLCVIEKLRHLDVIQGTREEALELFGGFLAPALREAADGLPSAEVLAELIGGGIFDVIQAHIVEHRLAKLPAALPAISTYTLAPFVGHDEALRIAGQI